MNNRLMLPRNSFLPTNLLNLELWLDASVASTVTLNGATVSQWRSRHNSAVHVGNAAAGQQPTWIASSKNGRSGINFPASTSLFTSSGGVTFNFNQPTSYFGVFQAPSSGTNWGLFDGVTTRQHVFGNNTTQFIMFAGSSAATATIVAGAWYAFVLVYNGASSSHRLNTKTATTVNPNTNAINDLRVGTSNGVRGDFNEFGMYSRAIADAEASKLLDYLAAKWAITVTA